MAYGYQIILDQSIPIISKLGSQNTTVFVPISGPDATGKTLLATKIKDELKEVLIFTTDNYLKNSREDRLKAAKDGKSGYWLEMHHVKLMFSDLEKLKVNSPIKKRVYNPVDGTTAQIEDEIVLPRKYIIVDSGISLTDAFLNVYPPVRFGIFISAKEQVRRILKNRRDIKERNYQTLYKMYSQGLVELFIRRNLEDCGRIVMPSAKNANLIAEIDEDYRIVSLILSS